MNGMDPMNFQPDLGGTSNDVSSVMEDVTVEDNHEEVSSSVIPDDGCFSFSCPRCGSVVSVNNSILGSYCVYCGLKGLSSVDHVNYSNYAVLPFTRMSKDAVATFKSKIRFNPFVPFYLRSSKTLKSIKKVYLACSLSNFEASGNISFLGADKVQNVKGAPKQTFESMYSTEFHFENILSSNFPRLGDEIISTINNYSFNNIQPFQTNYINGGYILDGNSSIERITGLYGDRLLKHVTNIVRGTNPHSLKKVVDNGITVKPSSVRTVLIPIYLLNIKDKDGDTLFVMNGQTGQSFVELPMSVLSIVVYSLIVFGIIFLVTFLMAHLF